MPSVPERKKLYTKDEWSKLTDEQKAKARLLNNPELHEPKKLL